MADEITPMSQVQRCESKPSTNTERQQRKNDLRRDLEIVCGYVQRVKKNQEELDSINDAFNRWCETKKKIQ